MIRVLYLNNAPFLGGAQVTFRNIVRLLDRSRFQPVIAIPSGSRELVAFFATSRAKVIVVPMPRLRPPTASSISGLVGTILRLREIVIRGQIDVVHTNTQRGGVLGIVLRAFTGVRFIWTINDLALLPQIRQLTRVADQITCVSGAVRDRLPDPAKARLIYNGVQIDDSILANRARIRAEIRSELGIPTEARVIGNVSRIERWKGVHVTAEAAARVLAKRGDVWFVQVGNVAPGSEQYAREVTSVCRSVAPGRVVFAGFRADVHRWYSIFDLLVHTPTTGQLGHSEAFGMNVAEAMGYGLPVVATKVGALGEVVEDGVTGILVPRDRPELAAEAVVALLDDPGRGASLGEAGQRRQQALFTQSREVRDFENLYEELVVSGRRERRGFLR